MSAFLKELTKPTDPFYLRLIKGSNVTMPEFSNRGVFYTESLGFGGTVTSNTTNPLIDVRDYIYTSGTTSNLDFFGYTFDVPTGVKGKDVAFNFNYKTSTSNFVVVVYALCTSGNRQIDISTPITIGTSQYQRVFTVPADCTGLKIGWQYTGSASGETFEYDNIVFSQWTPQAVNLVQQESISYTGYSSGTTSGIKFKTLLHNSGSSIVSSDNSGAYTKFIVLKKAQVNLQLTVWITATGNLVDVIERYNASGTLIDSVSFSTGSGNIARPPISFPTVAEAGDYFIAKITTGTPYDDALARFSITATAISDNVVQSWQDGTEWTPFTLAQINATGLAQGFGTLAGSTLRYKIVGSNLEMDGTFTIGTRTGVEARLPLPNGLLASTTATLALAGYVSSNTTGGSGQNFESYYENGKGYLTFGQQSSTSTGLTKQNGNTLAFNDNGVVSLKISVPIQGRSSTPTLLALPASKDNNKTYDQTQVNVTGINLSSYTARFYPYRTISKSTGLPVWRLAFNFYGSLSSTTSSFTGNINGVKFSSSNPYPLAGNLTQSGIANRTVMLARVDQNTSTFYLSGSDIFNLVSVSGDVELTRKPTWADEWIEPGVFVGNVAKNQVAMVVYKGTRTQLSATPVLMPLTSIAGDSFLSISANKLVLPVGEYNIKWTAFLNGTSTNGYSYLQNITDGIEYARSTNFEASSAYSQKDVSGAAKFSIAAQKEIGVYLYGSTTSCYIGGSAASPNDIQGFIEITKLNGQ